MPDNIEQRGENDGGENTGGGDLVTGARKLSLVELCECCGVSQEVVLSYVAEGIIEPEGQQREHWRFSRLTLLEVRRAFRLERDLGLNPAGVALALELMEEVKKLKARLASYETVRREGAD